MKIQIKKWDVIIVLLLIVISFLPYAFIKSWISDGAKSTYACITVDGEIYKEIPLTGQIGYREIEIDTEYGKNTLAIENEGIAVIKSDCRDHICEEFGFKKHIGETITCLPHKLCIEIKGHQREEVEEDLRTY